MKIEDILLPELTICNTVAGSKKRVLEYLSHILAAQMPDMDADRLYERFLFRERLGSTGIGEGVAIPHCRLDGCAKALGAFLKLAEPVDFDAVDENPVDLVFALVVPDEQHEEHLALLASIAGLLQDEKKRQQLRQATSSQALYELATAGS